MDSCDIYIRSTLSDGDSVAVREAIQLGKKVFATDVVSRPDACYLFSARDPDTLYSLFIRNQHKTSASIKPESSVGIEPILDVYQKASSHFRSKR